MDRSHRNAVKHLREDIAHTLELLRFSYEAIICIDEHQNVVLFNRGAESIFGYNAGEIVGQPLERLLPARFHDAHRDHVADFRNAGHPDLLMHERSPIYGLRRNGEEFPAEASVYSFRYGGEMTYTVVLRDITHAMDAKERLMRLASHDFLTDLPNRMLFNDRLSTAISRAARNHSKLALVYIDIDNFKATNDRYGHAAGDLYLKRVAERLQKALRETDTCARIGGDEFAVILESLHDREDLRITEGSLHECLEQPFALETGDAEILPSISLGIAVYPDDATDPEILLRVADHTMFTNKRAKAARR